jgi:hypothetical protein
VKSYGVQLGPFKTPAKETDPRHMPPNFYLQHLHCMELFCLKLIVNLLELAVHHARLISGQFSIRQRLFPAAKRTSEAWHSTECPWDLLMVRQKI